MNIVEKIKSLLLNNYVVACCGECLESLKSVANVVYLDKAMGFALIEKTQALKEFLGLDDRSFRELRMLSLSIRDGYCRAELVLGDIDNEKAEEVALVALAIVKLFGNSVVASTQYS